MSRACASCIARQVRSLQSRLPFLIRKIVKIVKIVKIEGHLERISLLWKLRIAEQSSHADHLDVQRNPPVYSMPISTARFGDRGFPVATADKGLDGETETLPPARALLMAATAAKTSPRFSASALE